MRGGACSIVVAAAVMAMPGAAARAGPRRTGMQTLRRSGSAAVVWPARRVPGFPDVSIIAEGGPDRGLSFHGATVRGQPVRIRAGEDPSLAMTRLVLSARGWPRLDPAARRSLFARWLAAGQPPGVVLENALDHPGHELIVASRGDATVATYWADIERESALGPMKRIAMAATIVAVSPDGTPRYEAAR